MRVLIAASMLLVLCVSPVLTQESDSAAIRQAALDYVGGYYEADWQRVSKGVHAELVKRIVIKDSLGNYMLRNMGASELVYSAKHNKNTNILNPDKPFEGRVTIYDIYGKAATAKVETNKFKFIDYVQLAKIGTEWKVVNVLWELKPDQK